MILPTKRVRTDAHEHFKVPQGIWGTVKIMVLFLGPHSNTGPNLGDPKKGP